MSTIEHPEYFFDNIFYSNVQKKTEFDSELYICLYNVKAILYH